MSDLYNKNEPMGFEDIEKAVEKEIEAAQEARSARAPDRQKNWDRYFGKPLGNEVKGRSQFLTRDLLETIEAILPFLIKLFASGDPKVEVAVVGQEAWIGKALMQKIQLDLGNATPNLFSLFYQWFKDALVSDTAYVKVAWDLDHANVQVDFDDLPAEQMQQLVDDDAVEITGSPTIVIEPQTGQIAFQGVSAKIKKLVKDALYAENTPYWEFLISSKARSMNDEYGKGQETEVSVDYLKRTNRAYGGKYFKNLDKLETGQGKDGADNLADGEKSSYEDRVDSSLLDGDLETGAKASVKFIEWYTRLDVDGDGYLENITTYTGNGHLLRWEKNEDEFIPFSSLSPIMNCYKFHGVSYADLLVEIQNLKTMLFRRILDNFDFQNSGRWLKDPNSSIDTSALLNNSPGSVITGKIDGLKDITPSAFQPATLSILEYVDTLKENRTSITKYNQGADGNSLNKTARGIQMIQSASMQRLELIGRIFAELGLKDFYRKCVLLYQKNLKQPFTMKVLGQEREITPDMIQGEVTTTVNMGVVGSVGQEEAEKIEHIITVLFSVNERFPGILTEESVHSLMSRYITSSGFNNVDDFIGDIEGYISKLQQSRQEQGQIQQQMMEFQKQLQQMELQIKAQDSQTKARKVEQDGVIAGAELQLEKELALAEIDQKDTDSRRDHQLGLLKSLAGAQKTRFTI
ncbi:MAG: hypothetical protein JRI41_02915 [Deltaproteobacteria bacterium]|nr:hypothetical protein [Deltaproteobacteria bacterium]